MKQMIDEIFSSFGSEAHVLTADGDFAVRAFVRPINAHSQENMQKILHALGQVPNGRWLYIGPASPLPEQDDEILCGGTRYVVCRMQTMLLRDEAVYAWGLLRELGGDGDAASD